MQNRIYLRILLSFLIVASFYTLIISFTLVRNAYSQQRSDTVNQIKSNLQQESNIIDEQLLAANNTAIALSNKASVQRLAAAKPQAFNTYANIYDDINANPDFANYSSEYSVGVTRGYKSKIISSSGYFSFSSYIRYIDLEPDQKQIKHFLKNPPEAGIGIIESNNQVLLIRTATVSKNVAPVFYLICWPKSALSPLTIYNNKGSLHLVDTLSKASSKQLPDIHTITKRLNSHQVTRSMVIQHRSGNKQYFVRESNVIPTALFTYEISDSDISRIPANLVQTLILYFVVLLFVGGLLVVFLSRRSFRPYAKIIDEVQQIDSNVRPQNAEVLLQKIHDLVESNHQYANMQDNVTHDLKLLFLKNLLLNSYSQKDISRFVDILSLDDLQNGGVIGILTFSQIAVSEEPLGINERKDARKKTIISSWPTTLNLIFDIDVNHYAIIDTNTTDSAGLITSLNVVTKQLSKRLDIPVHALVSVPFKNLYEIPTRFADAYATATTTPDTQPSITSAIMASSGNYTIETETAILTSASQRDFAKSLQLTDDSLSKALAIKGNTLAALTNIKFVYLNTLKRALLNGGLSVTDFIDDHHAQITQLNLETDINSIRRTLLTLFESAFSKISELSLHHRTLEEHIVDYIARRYTSDLALSEIADHYHLSESHTSRLIKEHLGISFKDYLIQLRMRQAKSLLNNSDQKVADIAEAVGYKNVNTFIRVFKATTGQTPGKFRRSTDID